MDAVTTPRWAQRMQQVQPNAIGELLRLGAEPGVMSFGGGYPDAGLFPIAGLEEVFREAISGTGGAALQYTVAEGSPKLRAQIAARMTADGAACDAEDVLVLQGGQQGLDLLGRLLLDPGDVVVTEDPTFLGALIAFDPCQPRYAAVPMDAEGMDMAALEAVLKATPRARVIYTIPDFQNPTGVTMSLPRRLRLLELAEEFDLMVIEDTPYRPLRFAGTHLPTLKSLDRSGRVIFLGSFSKILAPGLRLGWAVASRPVIERLTLLKLAADTQCSTLNMAAASLFLERFDVDAHVATIRSAYAEKKEKMLGAIRRHFPQSVTCTDPEGGMFTWLTFPEGFDATAFMRDHALPEVRVAYVPGASFFPVTPRPNHARLSYSAPSLDTIERGMAALGGLLKRHL